MASDTLPPTCPPEAKQLSENVQVFYNTCWKNTYHTPVKRQGKIWVNRYVDVVDPDPPKLGRLRQRAIQYRANGDRIISKNNAVLFAQQEIDQYKLAENPDFQNALKETQVADPILVQRLDRADTFDYYVPYNRKDGTSVIAKLDALYGFKNEITYTKKPLKYPLLSLQDIKDIIAEGVLEVHDWAFFRDGARDVPAHHFTIRPETFSLYPILVWQPCWESRSPFFPFYYVNVGGRQLYIASWNGRVYDGLHPFARSGVPRGV